MKNSGGSSISLNVNLSPTHSFSPERKPPQNVESFKNYLKKYDKKELFQSASFNEIQMYGSEKLLERKKELQFLDHHQSLELSMESVESPENRRNFGKNFHKERNERFQRVAGNVIIPIEEFNKLEDVQTPQVIDRFSQLNRKTTVKNIRNDKKVIEEDSNTMKNFGNDKKLIEEDSKTMKNFRNDKKVIDEDSNAMKNFRNDKKVIDEDDSTKVLREYLANIKKQVIISDEKNMNNVSKMSDSLEFAVVNDKAKSFDEEGGIFSVRKKFRK